MVRALIATLHLLVGTLVLFRARIERHGSWASCLVSVPSILIAGWAVRVAPKLWTVPALSVFLVGACLTIVSFLYLGRSFAILPAVRGTVTTGPFRIVRHPAYLGEVLMICGCCIADPRLPHLGPLAAGLPLVAFRILAEERVMSTSAAYVEYKNQVRKRLIPLFW